MQITIGRVLSTIPTWGKRAPVFQQFIGVLTAEQRNFGVSRPRGMPTTRSRHAAYRRAVPGMEFGRISLGDAMEYKLFKVFFIRVK